jgi:hypothetical protein
MNKKYLIFKVGREVETGYSWCVDLMKNKFLKQQKNIELYI